LAAPPPVLDARHGQAIIYYIMTELNTESCGNTLRRRSGGRRDMAGQAQAGTQNTCGATAPATLPPAASTVSQAPDDALDGPRINDRARQQGRRRRI